MGKKLYVGNLPFSVTSAELEQMFSPHGKVTWAQVVMDRATNRSRGFGFVEFESEDACAKAAADMNGKPFGGRALTVNEARERPMGGGPGGGGPGGGGPGGFGGQRPGGGFRRGPLGPRAGGFDRGPGGGFDRGPGGFDRGEGDRGRDRDRGGRDRDRDRDRDPRY